MQAKAALWVDAWVPDSSRVWPCFEHAGGHCELNRRWCNLRNKIGSIEGSGGLDSAAQAESSNAPVPLIMHCSETLEPEDSAFPSPSPSPPSHELASYRLGALANFKLDSAAPTDRTAGVADLCSRAETLYKVIATASCGLAGVVECVYQRPGNQYKRTMPANWGPKDKETRERQRRDAV